MDAAEDQADELAGAESFAVLARAQPSHADYRCKVAACYHNMGRVWADAGAYAEAITWFEKALPLFTALAQEQPDHPDYSKDVQGTLRRLEEARRLLAAANGP
jgi:tetratricopeptide (TPR) repeat protein